jgi:hypothetical protein
VDRTVDAVPVVRFAPPPIERLRQLAPPTVLPRRRRRRRHEGIAINGSGGGSFENRLPEPFHQLVQLVVAVGRREPIVLLVGVLAFFLLVWTFAPPELDQGGIILPPLAVPPGIAAAAAPPERGAVRREDVDEVEIDGAGPSPRRPPRSLRLPLLRQLTLAHPRRDGIVPTKDPEPGPRLDSVLGVPAAARVQRRIDRAEVMIEGGLVGAVRPVDRTGAQAVVRRRRRRRRQA